MLRQRLWVTILSRAFLGTIALAGLALNAQVGWAQPNEKKTEQQKLEGKPTDTKPQAAAEPPAEWIEPSTGHRVIRLSREPGTSSFYFHQNAYTATGDKLVVSTRQGLATINLQTREIEPLGVGRAGQVVVGKKTRQVFYTRDGSV